MSTRTRPQPHARRRRGALAAVALAGAVLTAVAGAAPPGTVTLVSRTAGFGPVAPGTVNESSLWGDPSDPGEQSLRTVSDEGGRYTAFVSLSDGLSDADDDRVSNVYVRDRVTGITTLVSRADGPAGAGADGSSDTPAISPDGRYVAFRSSATNLSDADEAGTSQIYLRDLLAGTTTLVSRANGAAGLVASSSSFAPALAVDGTTPVVAFVSSAPNLPGANGVAQVYLRRAGTTTLISTVDGTGNPGVAASGAPALDDDGDFVAFVSEAQLLPGALDDNNAHPDVYRRTVANQDVELVSRISGVGAAGNDDSARPSISDDGTAVAFDSRASDLVAGDGNGESDVFVRTIGANAMERVSVRSDGTQGDDESVAASITGSGATVVFVSRATNLSSGLPDDDGLPDAYRHSRGSGATALFSTQAAGGVSSDASSTAVSLARDGEAASWQGVAPPREAGDDDDFPQVYTTRFDILSISFLSGWVSRPTGLGPFRSRVNASGLRAPARSEEPLQAMSADGRYTVFVSRSDELSDGDDDRFANIFRRDNLTGETVLVSRADGMAGAAADGGLPGGTGLGAAAPNAPAISADGRFVAFESEATNLVAGDTNARVDVFVRDVVAGTTVRASLAPDGSEIPLGGRDPDISGDGTRVVFVTSASLVGQDGNVTDPDVYLRDLAAGTTTFVSRRNGAGTVNGPESSTAPVISDDGAAVAFTTANTGYDPTVADVNGDGDVYLRRLATDQTLLVSRRAAVASAGGDASFAPAIDATGTRVAFASLAPDLVSAALDANGGGRDVFVRDLAAGTTVLVSRRAGVAGVGVEGGGSRPSISGDGARVAFESGSGLLVDGDLNGTQDIFLRDLTDQSLELVSRLGTGPLAGNQLADFAGDPSLSADGSCIAFTTPDPRVGPAGLAGSDFTRVAARALRGDCPFGPVAAGPGDPPPGPADPGPAADTTRPVVGSLRAVPVRFRAGARLRAGTRTRPAVGTRLRFRLSEPARVAVRVIRLVPGRRVRGRCVPSARTGRRCVRPLLRGTITARRAAGARSVVVTGRLRNRLLAPGRYRLSVIATDAAGNRSVARSRVVTILAPPRPARRR